MLSVGGGDALSYIAKEKKGKLTHLVILDSHIPCFASPIACTQEGRKT
jgi:hypothetical protein